MMAASFASLIEVVCCVVFLNLIIYEYILQDHQLSTVIELVTMVSVLYCLLLFRLSLLRTELPTKETLESQFTPILFLLSDYLSSLISAWKIAYIESTSKFNFMLLIFSQQVLSLQCQDMPVQHLCHLPYLVGVLAGR